MYQAMHGAVPQDIASAVSALRQRLWRRNLLAGALTGLSWGALAATVLVLAALWETREPTALQPFLVGGAVAVLGVLATAARPPTLADTARAADRSLALEERLATAMEILEGRLVTSLAGRQLDDAWRALQSRPYGQIAPLSPLRRRALATLGCLAVFAGCLTAAYQFEPSLNPVAALRRNVEERFLTATGLDEALGQLPFMAPGELADPFSTKPPDPLLNAQTEEQLREQMVRSRNQQAALSRLARALMGTAAARGVGEQLQRGNYAEAAGALQELARENDQLSAEAKAELARALEQAANETAEFSPELARAAEQAARALSSPNRDYRSIQQSLEQLGQRMAEAGRQVIPQEELAQAWQRLQESRQQESDALSAGAPGAELGEFQVLEAPSSASAAGAAALAGPGGEDGEGQPMGTTVTPGSSPGAYDPNSRATRLNVAGKELSIEGRPSGSGEGRGTGHSGGPAVSLKDVDETGAQKEGIPQPTEPIRESPEHTTVPLQHLRAVHDYFQTGEKNP